MAELTQELKELIIDTARLEDVSVEEIETEMPLFVEGLGLDSVDALELAMAIEKKFGVRIEGEDAQLREIFKNVKTLAAFIEEHRASA